MIDVVFIPYAMINMFINNDLNQYIIIFNFTGCKRVAKAKRINLRGLLLLTTVT